MSEKKKVLFICTHNSACSKIMESLMQPPFGDCLASILISLIPEKKLREVELLTVKRNLFYPLLDHLEK